MLKDLMEVVRPVGLKGNKGIVKGMEEWEVKIKDWEKSYDEKLSERIKAAVFIGMLPKDLQDEVYRGVVAEGPNQYTDMRDRIKRIVQNRVVQETPTPMDIGQVVEGRVWAVG